MATLTDLAVLMDGLGARVSDFGNQVKKDVATTVLTDLVQVTPIDTGEAVSNWQVTLDSPAQSILPAFAPAPKGRMVKGTWEHKADPVATAQGNVPPTIDAGNNTIQGAQPGQPIFITNNAEQIVPLNEGSSVQAPSGFVDRALILGADTVGRARFIP